MTDTVTPELDQQVRFLVEVDKLKSVDRRSMLVEQSRNENSAEHSWHVALCAMILAPYASSSVDVDRVIRMLLVHDLVEIDAGDTFAYDAVGRQDQHVREKLASERLFGLLAGEQKDTVMLLWQEFEAVETPESKFANAVDRFMPLLHNYHTSGVSWRQHQVSRAQVMERMSIIREGAPPLWRYVTELLDDAVERGYLLP